MDWNETGLVSLWTSSKLSETVVGYRVADMTNNNYFIALQEAKLVVYDLE